MSVNDAPPVPLRLGFLGTGWIGASRMQALLSSGLGQAVAVADADPAARERAAEIAPGAVTVAGLEEMLELAPDGVVIATPSALHARQALTALAQGVAVFCQKPLARSGAETREVLDGARRAGRPFGVDLSYRHTAAAVAIREALAAGAVADLYAIDLVFHNAYGPDKPWFVDRRLSGGGAVIDLGTHLLDLALWLTGARAGRVTETILRRHGRPLDDLDAEVEDFAWVQLETEQGVSVRLACSWFLPAGRDCEIACTLYGADQALSMHNVDGSFYDFCAELRSGTRSQTLTTPPDDWGARALVAWARRLLDGEGFDAAAASVHQSVADLIDAIYGVGPEARS